MAISVKEMSHVTLSYEYAQIKRDIKVNPCQAEWDSRLDRLSEVTAQIKRLRSR